MCINTRKCSCCYWIITWRKLIISRPTEHYFIIRDAEMDLSLPLILPGSHLHLVREKNTGTILPNLPLFRNSDAYSSLYCPDQGAMCRTHELAEMEQSLTACFAFSRRSSPVREAWLLFFVFGWIRPFCRPAEEAGSALPWVLRAAIVPRVSHGRHRNLACVSPSQVATNESSATSKSLTM